MPPRKSTAITVVANPGTGSRPMRANCLAKMRCRSVKSAPRKATMDTQPPKYVASRSGWLEKLNTPSTASSTSLRSVYFVSPPARPWRS